MANPISITIVDQSSILREGLACILRNIFPNVTLNSMGSTGDICQYIEDNRPNIVIINPVTFTYNRGEKISFLRQCATQRNCKLAAMIYAYFDEKMLQSFDEVIYIDDTEERIKEKMVSLLEKKNEPVVEAVATILSQREIDVLKLLALGLSNKEIADQLHISTHTAISHRKNITTKLGVRSTSALTIYAVINKLISEDDYSKSV